MRHNGKETEKFLHKGHMPPNFLTERVEKRSDILKEVERSSSDGQKYHGEEDGGAQYDKQTTQQRRKLQERSRYQQLLPGFKVLRRARVVRGRTPPRGKHDEPHPLIKRPPSPWTMLRPVMGAMSTLLPCNLPDTFLKEELHNRQSGPPSPLPGAPAS